MYQPNGTEVYEIDEVAELLGDQHHSTSIDTPLTEEAFNKTDDEKMAIIQEHFAEIMKTLGLDLSDDSLQGTPRRVAKMYVKEIFKGLKKENAPSISLFDNTYHYNRMLIEKNIKVKSTCEHHFLPIMGKAHVAYISSGKVIGLSKLNRIVDYYARRPQVQERMTKQILQALQDVLDTKDVIVVIEAAHMCVSCRGIEDESSTTITMEYGGNFINQQRRNEFLELVKHRLEL